MAVLQWHGDIFDLPQGSVNLASSTACPHQAFRYKNVYGFLFHFEFTPQMIKELVEIDREWIHKDNVIDEGELVRLAVENEELMIIQCKRLIGNFLKIC